MGFGVHYPLAQALEEPDTAWSRKTSGRLQNFQLKHDTTQTNTLVVKVNIAGKSKLK